jgi:hypothetical protein
VPPYEAGIHVRAFRAPATIRGALVALTAIVAAPLVAIGGYGIYRSYEGRRDAEIEASAELARATALTFEAFVEDVMRVEQTLGVASTGHGPDHVARDMRDVIADLSLPLYRLPAYPSPRRQGSICPRAAW